MNEPFSNPINSSFAPLDPEESEQLPAEEALQHPPVDRDWKAALREDIDSWLDSLEDDPEVSAHTDTETEPDLYSFYESLIALSFESRKANRRTVEAFNQWTNLLVGLQENMDRWGNQIQKFTDVSKGKFGRQHALAVIEIADRIERLVAAFQQIPDKRWWSNDLQWRESWKTQARAMTILLEHVQEFLKQEGIHRIETLGKPFDPRYMSAVDTEPSREHPRNTVLKEESPGYTWSQETLRIAQVILSRDHVS